MKHSFIKYEKLSNEIKDEIHKYHQSMKAQKSEAVFDESIAEWFENRFDEWLLKRYSSDEHQGRRKFFRLEVEIPIRIIDTLIESSRDDKHAMEFIGKIVNISRGGLYFKSSKPIEISSIIKVIIDFSGVDKDLNEVEALAMVIRSDKLPEEDYGIGIMFSSIYEPNKERLDLFILKNLSYYIYSE
ncbi:MAG TPA: PilZ domain-containing protein [Spirochaetota bacterium]|nr:PilZ domain-containing protein [Spirochaetota bacterium]HPV40801.1 PilZ domain-containing protein [Spirochaetota bacterium]